MHTNRIRIIKHEAVPGCGSFEIRFADGRESQFFYWDDIPARRMRPETLDRETALEKAKAVARLEIGTVALAMNLIPSFRAKPLAHGSERSRLPVF
jgi:hypothetical protein